ncbi:hypothetical protein N665_0032s0037 [Sinapis alba]|nr:hypothetical protein N665_0032s0037 [Sinapis alba]
MFSLQIYLVINLPLKSVEILDSRIDHIDMTTHNTFLVSFPYEKNLRSRDCGPCMTKFFEMHVGGYGYDEMAKIDDKVVNNFRQKYKIGCYEKFIRTAKSN